MVPAPANTKPAFEFVGPYMAHVFGAEYVTMTDAGVKQQGAPFAGVSHGSEAEALDALEAHLSAFTKGAEQIAWRRPREAVCGLDGWRATCRLAVFRA